jgi:hypothetical protein
MPVTGRSAGPCIECGHHGVRKAVHTTAPISWGEPWLDASGRENGPARRS